MQTVKLAHTIQYM